MANQAVERNAGIMAKARGGGVFRGPSKIAGKISGDLPPAVASGGLVSNGKKGLITPASSRGHLCF